MFHTTTVATQAGSSSAPCVRTTAPVSRRRGLALLLTCSLAACADPTAPAAASPPEPAPPALVLSLTETAPLRAGAQYATMRVSGLSRHQWTLDSGTVNQQSVPSAKIDDSTVVIFVPEPTLDSSRIELRVRVNGYPASDTPVVRRTLPHQALGSRWAPSQVLSALQEGLIARIDHLANGGVDQTPRPTSSEVTKLREQAGALTARLASATPVADRVLALLATAEPQWLENADRFEVRQAAADRAELFKTCRISYPDGRACVATGGADLREQLVQDSLLVDVRRSWDRLVSLQIDTAVTGWLRAAADLELRLTRLQMRQEEYERLLAPVWPTRLSADPRPGTVAGGATSLEGALTPLGVRARGESLNQHWLRAHDTTDWGLAQWLQQRARVMAHWAATPLPPLAEGSTLAWPSLAEYAAHRMDFTPPLQWLDLTLAEVPYQDWQVELESGPEGPSLRAFSQSNADSSATPLVILNISLRLQNPSRLSGDPDGRPLALRYTVRRLPPATNAGSNGSR